MTWRERIAAARELGRFSEEDSRLIGDFQTCMVGECSRPLTEQLGQPAWWVHLDLHEMGTGDVTRAIWRNDFDLAERCLDAIEDRVLQLKRGEA